MHQWKYIVNGVAQLVQVVAIDGYPIISGSTMPSSLAESACFVNSNSITGTGQVSLTVNITPPYPLSNKLSSGRGRLAGGGSASLAYLVLLAHPRRRGRGSISVVSMGMAFLFTAMGCSGGGGRVTDPGTTKGTDNIVVAGTAGSGASPSQVSVSVPITID